MPAENTADMGTRNVEDLTGRTFGLLTVVGREESRNGRSRWLCRCTCGGEKIVTAHDLKAGKVKSCGCFKKENQEKIVDRLHRVDGTCIEFLEKRKYRKDNKSGFRGVFRTANGRYRVSIGFRGRPYLRRVSGSIPAVP